jgi:hypothetical protein
MELRVQPRLTDWDNLNTVYLRKESGDVAALTGNPPSTNSA